MPADDLRAVLGGSELRDYRPQAAFLSLLNTADDRALLRWRGVLRHARVATWLKDRIDRRFVGRCRRSSHSNQA